MALPYLFIHQEEIPAVSTGRQLPTPSGEKIQRKYPSGGTRIAAFQDMHLSPTEHSDMWLPDRRTGRQTTGQTYIHRTKWSISTVMLHRQHNYMSPAVISVTCDVILFRGVIFLSAGRIRRVWKNNKEWVVVDGQTDKANSVFFCFHWQTKT